MVHQNISHAEMMLRLQGVDGVGNGRRVVEVFVLVEQFHSGMVLLSIIIWKKGKKRIPRKVPTEFKKYFVRTKKENISTRKVPTEFKKYFVRTKKKTKVREKYQQNSMSLSEPVNRTTVLGTEMKKNTLTRCTMDISDTTTGFSRCC